MGKTAREVMTGGAECVGENETMVEAAKKMAELDVGALPICGEDNRLKGMLTDRDIAVKVLAQDKDPSSTKAGELGEGKPVTIGADDSVEEVLRTMKEEKVRRLPVIDGHDLVGIVSQGDLATNISEERVGDLVEAISAHRSCVGRGPDQRQLHPRDQEERPGRTLGQLTYSKPSTGRRLSHEHSRSCSNRDRRCDRNRLACFSAEEDPRPEAR